MFFFGYCRSKNGSARDEVKGPPHEILPVAFGDFLGSGEQYIVFYCGFYSALIDRQQSMQPSHATTPSSMLAEKKE